MWNATLICTNVYKSLDKRNFKIGHIYNICDGHLIDGNNNKSSGTYKNLEELKDSFYADFIEISKDNDNIRAQSRNG